MTKNTKIIVFHSYCKRLTTQLHKTYNPLILHILQEKKHPYSKITPFFEHFSSFFPNYIAAYRHFFFRMKANSTYTKRFSFSRHIGNFFCYTHNKECETIQNWQPKSANHNIIHPKVAASFHAYYFPLDGIEIRS